MRIVSGRFGGRKLHVPAGRNVRPTSDKVRGAMFNALSSRGAVENAVVLDCFCGTGALGLEALSRGAARCTFIDKARDSLDLARSNASDFGLKDEVSFILKDATNFGRNLERTAQVSLVFLDPPYDKGFVSLALNSLHENSWLADGAIIVAETEKSFIWANAKIFSVLDERIYKDTKITYARYTKIPE